VIRDGGRQVFDRVSWCAPVPTIHKRDWWNLLFGNLAGYLLDNSALEASTSTCRGNSTCLSARTGRSYGMCRSLGVLLLALLAIKSPPGSSKQRGRSEAWR
jgi:hypothetical protein